MIGLSHLTTRIESQKYGIESLNYQITLKKYSNHDLNPSYDWDLPVTSYLHVSDNLHKTYNLRQRPHNILITKTTFLGDCDYIV